VKALAAVLVIVTGCGRYGYDLLASDDVDAETDAADDGDGGGDDGDGRADGLIHDYRLDGDYTDELGGPDLTSLGGNLVSGGYMFGANQGLGVIGAMPDSVYSIDIVFQLDSLAGWRKVLDFKNYQSDDGYYTYDDHLQFVVVAGSVFADGTTPLTANTSFQSTLTRDASGHVVGYVNHVMQFEFDDTAGVAQLEAPGAVAHFFVDDTVTGGGEAAGGVVRRIRMYDRALGASELPEP
jgi:hypothetical protein